MEITKENNKDLNYKIEFEIKAEDINKKYQEELKKYQGQVEIKGFRKGKAPLNIVEQKYGAALKSDVINQMTQDAVSKIIKDKNLKPAEKPKVSIDFEKNDDLKGTVEFEVLPTIPDIDFSKIEIEKPEIELDEKDVEDSLKKIAESRRTSEKIKEDRPIKKGDVAVIDFEGFIDNKPFDGGKANSHFLEIGSKSFIGDFEDQLIGKKTGDKTDVKVKFPKDYHANNLADKDALFKVEIKEIRERKTPAINDELAKQLKKKDLKDLTETVKTELKKSYNNSAKEKMKDSLIDKLDEKVKFKLPENLVKQEFDVLWKQIEHAKKTGRLSEEDKKKSDKKLKDEYEKLAAKRVKLGLLLADVGNKNKIQVAKEDLEQLIMAEAMRFPGQEKKVFEYYSKNPQALDSLKGPAYENKIMDFMLEKVKTKSKKMKKDELFKKK